MESMRQEYTGSVRLPLLLFAFRSFSSREINLALTLMSCNMQVLQLELGVCEPCVICRGLSGAAHAW